MTHACRYAFDVGDYVRVSSFPGGHYVGRVEKCVPGAELSDPYGENLYQVSGLMKLQRERVLSRAGASSNSDTHKSATPTTPVENKRTLYDVYSEMLALLEEEEPGVIHKITITKSATPETEPPCRCGVVPLPDEAYPFFNPHDLHSATPEKERPE